MVSRDILTVFMSTDIMPVQVFTDLQTALVSKDILTVFMPTDIMPVQVFTDLLTGLVTKQNKKDIN